MAYQDKANGNRPTVMAHRLTSGISLLSGTNPANAVQPVILTASVSPVAATGMVDGDTDLGTAPLSNGMATVITTSLAAGDHTITASYSGDTRYGCVLSTPLIQTITDLMKGDVNRDTVVNVFDALLTLQYAVGLYKPTDETTFKSAADVEPLDVLTSKPKGDSKIDVFDALAILRHAVGLDGW